MHQAMLQNSRRTMGGIRWMCGVRKNWGYLREGQGGREGRIDREATKTEVRKTGRQERQRGKEDRRGKEAGRRGSRETR